MRVHAPGARPRCSWCHRRWQGSLAGHRAVDRDLQHRAGYTEALRRGIEERAAATLLRLYAEDTELRVVDQQHQPSPALVIRGRAAIGEYFADVCGRDLTHQIERLVADDRGAAFVQTCQYPDGTRVLCTAVLDLHEGLITRQAGVQAWDEAAQPAAGTRRAEGLRGGR